MADFAPAYEQAILVEGGYTLHNVAGDRGGLTYAGISRRAHPEWPGWALVDAGQAVPAALVRAFYHSVYWLRLRLDNVRDQDVAECIFLAAVNAEAAVKVLQIALGVTPDGVIGPKTLDAVNAADPDRLIDRFTVAKVARYASICNRDRSQSKFLLGWINRVVKEAGRGV